MAQSCCNFKNVYSEFNKIDGYFGEKNINGLRIERINGLIYYYCLNGKTSGKGNCNGYFDMASSGVMHLLKNLKDKNGLEYDKLAEYAILWLSYKLNKYKHNNINKLNEFYTKYIEKNKHYNDKINDSGSMTYKEIINKKKDLMNMTVKELSKFYEALTTLCNMYNNCNKSGLNCKNCSNYAKTFADKFKELNKDSIIPGNSLYNKMLSTLSDDYNNLKNNYGSSESCNFPSLPELTPQKNSVEKSRNDSGQPTALIPEATSSSSSISTTLIPALSTFSVIPVFLGIAYKYSLFGIDKLFQRQYLRKKLKKVKKKMKLNM
ncbi:CIR protein PIR protein [Plasmodium vinckei lentum]|uniref:CIR protein PIR protein n=1 Tax=Plasmodium vinckei lentum TaxID=138297 RepID=A0A6V7RXV0_PLAVN|nr:CIR protein PIR protein [Plasmodium vinckei lentum]